LLKQKFQQFIARSTTPLAFL